MTAEYIRDWQQPRHAVGREGTGIPAPESALSSWLDAYRVENERRQEMADAAFSATPLGNLINKSLDAQEKQDKTITLAGDARKQARGAVDEAMARCACCRPICAIRLFATSPSCAKNRKPIVRKAKELAG